MVFSAVEMQQIFGNNAFEWDTLVNVATLGLNTIWKHDIISNIANINATEILELGSGTGALTLFIAESFPKAHITAMDISDQYTSIARQRAAYLGLSNIDFIKGDAQTPSKFVRSNYKTDIIISSYLAKYLDNYLFVKDIQNITHQKSVIITHELAYPQEPLGQLLYNNHVNLFALLLQVNPLWKPLATELTTIFINNQWYQQHIAALRQYNYQVKIYSLPLGFSSIIHATKK